ncbi:MAG: dicarboxylate/amino acid:cation symporter [Sedimentisphaerales bacterium]|nr:dicarboxylate/amino acid:cation symporter [Sedimentisphaerales bacterium]
MTRILKAYLKTSIILRIFIAFALGAAIGGFFWHLDKSNQTALAQNTGPYISPFGTIFVHMLQMIVIPVIFFSLVTGAASLPIKKFGRIGIKTILWYLACSLIAAVVGTFIALAVNPGSKNIDSWQDVAGVKQAQADEIIQTVSTEGALTKILLNLFKNPFEALSTGNFLSIIVFAILFGLALRVTIEAAQNDQTVKQLEMLENLFIAARETMFKIVDWILEYAPIGVVALTIINFGMYGPDIVGPYISVTLGVIAGISVMVFGVYSIMLWIITRHNPFIIFKKIREAMLMAFITRSSAATLPVTIKVAEEKLNIRNELAGFSLPLGATINMDGTCVQLPMFAVLAANMFGITLTPAGLAILVITTVLASIGAGGVPGGSLMLLFIVLETMGLNPDQVAIIVALALGINPILDMFETANNVTGDLVCTFAVAHNENLINSEK